MGENTVNFGNKKKKKKNRLLQQKQKNIYINVIDVNKKLVFKKELYGKYNSFQYFIGYNDSDVIRPLYLELSQMTAYINKSDEDKNKNKNKNIITMYLKVKDTKFLKNCNEKWKKNEILMSIDFISKPIYGNDNKYIKTKVKTYEDSITTNFKIKVLLKN